MLSVSILMDLLSVFVIQDLKEMGKIKVIWTTISNFVDVCLWFIEFSVRILMNVQVMKAYVIMDNV